MLTSFRALTTLSAMRAAEVAGSIATRLPPPVTRTVVYMEMAIGDRASGHSLSPSSVVALAAAGMEWWSCIWDSL